MLYKPISTILYVYVKFLEEFCFVLLFQKIFFPVILFVHHWLKRNLPQVALSLLICYAPSLPIGFTLQRHNNAGRCSIERAGPLLCCSQLVCQLRVRNVLSSVPCLWTKVNNSIDCWDDNNAMCRELIKFGLQVCAAVRGKERAFFMVSWLCFHGSQYISVVRQMMISWNGDR
jgi:hypothetical protein